MITSIILQVPGLIDQLLPPWLRGIMLLLVALMLVYLTYRSYTSKYWKEERDAATTQNQRLREEITTKETELVVLRARTDLTDMRTEFVALIGQLSKEHIAITEALNTNAVITRGFQSQVASTFEGLQVTLHHINNGLERLFDRESNTK